MSLKGLKTEHSGAKHANSGYTKAETKAGTKRLRREQDKYCPGCGALLDFCTCHCDDFVNGYDPFGGWESDQA